MVALKTDFIARASLIDRLVDLDPRSHGEVRPLRSLDREQLKESIRRNLGWLLNTRTSFPADLIDRRDLTVMDYGIPDFGSYSPQDPDDQTLLARRITRSISAFEPRLQKVKVIIEPEMENEKRLRIRIDAVMIAESVTEPVSFQTVFQSKSATWELHERV